MLLRINVASFPISISLSLFTPYFLCCFWPMSLFRTCVITWTHISSSYVQNANCIYRFHKIGRPIKQFWHINENMALLRLCRIGSCIYPFCVGTFGRNLDLIASELRVFISSSSVPLQLVYADSSLFALDLILRTRAHIFDPCSSILFLVSMIISLFLSRGRRKLDIRLLGCDGFAWCLFFTYFVT